MQSSPTYRLEMGTKMANGRGKSLFTISGARVSLTGSMKTLLTMPTLLSSISHRMNISRPSTPKALGRTVISAKFLNVKDGEARTLMYYAKHARGSMARWIMENRVDRAEGLKDFNAGAMP